MNVRDLVGKRVLGKTSSGDRWQRDTSVTEFKVVEVSPSGNWVKLQNLYGNKFWKPVAEFSYVETLQDIRPGGEVGA